MGVHYVSDILAGTILGIVVALLCLQIYQPLIGWIETLVGFPLW
jgi:membrane-associated phospholipid phosphatase